VKYLAAKRNDNGSWEPIAVFTNGLIAGEWLDHQALRGRTWMHLFATDSGLEIQPKVKPAPWMRT